ncbi:MAG: ABC-ATPase UvrA, partial [Lachnospiraceae bacterium]|nr:ABC-ATPase UvrA [Lachnospiraceae bacterium]
PACRGKGYIEKYIQYFGETRIVCSECNGQRYIDEVLSVKYQNTNIKQVLDMTFAEASDFFDGQKNIQEKIRLVCDLGLGYLQLGQPLNTLSGGEAQRIKLAKEMTRYRNQKNLLYIFDEPTIGLHTKDIEKITAVMRRIIEAQNTIVVVEHHPDIILSSDYIIDLGPGAGRHGGRVVFAGTPSQLLECRASKTAEYLRKR